MVSITASAHPPAVEKRSLSACLHCFSPCRLLTAEERGNQRNVPGRQVARGLPKPSEPCSTAEPNDASRKGIKRGGGGMVCVCMAIQAVAVQAYFQIVHRLLHPSVHRLWARVFPVSSVRSSVHLSLIEVASLPCVSRHSNDQRAARSFLRQSTASTILVVWPEAISLASSWSRAQSPSVA